MRFLVRVALASLPAVFLGLNAPAAEPDQTELARKARDILKTHCYRCHGQDGANEGGFNFALDRQQLVKRKRVVPGDAGKSKLYQRVTNATDPMPPEDEKVRPGAADIVLLRQWIEAGAPDFDAPPAQRTFITSADIVRHIRDDLAGLNERDRRFTRYFTLTHLHNAGLSEDELQSYRHGLSKLVNSLSWGGRVVVPKPIDPARTVFRIDLRDYQWNEKVWETILASHPYGVLPDSDAARTCTTETRCQLPFVRGDWFVAAASRPPLYHDVLQLPASEPELEKLLRVDTAENVRLERVARAGFNGSGVSRNNRLIERHESGQVVYWKSYDFAGNTGRQNLFAHPLGPDGEGAFRHDGGEIIFNLPNGLQGYFLSDARGRRLDKGPTAIVSDPKRPDRAVENGISCMSCHARGMIPKADQVRAHVLQNPSAFTKAEAETVRALYPPTEKFNALLQGDAQRFKEAVEKTGAPLSATEPIVALALRFEAEMDLSLVAAEAGVSAEELLKALERSAELGKRIGSLKVEGGTIQRQVFVDVFGELVLELKLGEFLPPRALAYAKLIQRGDELTRKGDPVAVQVYAEAIALDPRSTLAYHQRAAAHHDRRDFERAIADYTEALRLDPKDAVALHNRGSAYHDQGEYDRAIADFTEAIRLAPRYATAFNGRGLAHVRKRQLDQAVADFTEALKLDPKYALAHYNRGAAHHARRDLEKAIADYGEALTLDPTLVHAFNNRGLAHFERRDLEKAIADYTQALKLAPKFAVAHHNRGVAHSSQGRLDEAIRDFSEAIRLDPKFARAYLHRGQAYQKKGDAARAAADRKQALLLDPSLDRD